MKRRAWIALSLWWSLGATAAPAETSATDTHRPPAKGALALASLAAVGLMLHRRR